MLFLTFFLLIIFYYEIYLSYFTVTSVTSACFLSNSSRNLTIVDIGMSRLNDLTRP